MWEKETLRFVNSNSLFFLQAAVNNTVVVDNRFPLEKIRQDLRTGSVPMGRLGAGILAADAVKALFAVGGSWPRRDRPDAAARAIGLSLLRGERRG